MAYVKVGKTKVFLQSLLFLTHDLFFPVCTDVTLFKSNNLSAFEPLTFTLSSKLACSKGKNGDQLTAH